MNKTILGIDNGLKGAMSFYDGVELMVSDIPVMTVKERSVLDVHAIIRLIKEDMPHHVYIEKTTPMPKISGLSGYSMGHSEGVMIGILSALQVPYTLVRPADWKKSMGCPADKDAARQRASQLLPHFSHNWPLKKHDGRAEASLIALYGYNKQ